MVVIASRLAGDRGSQIVELAMVTPVLLLLIGGIVDFGFVFRTWQVATNAAREGARAGTLATYDCETHAQPWAEQYLARAAISGVVTATQTDIDGMEVCRVAVVVSQTLASLRVLSPLFGGNLQSVNVGASATMRLEIQLPTGP